MDKSKFHFFLCLLYSFTIETFLYSFSVPVKICWKHVKQYNPIGDSSRWEDYFSPSVIWPILNTQIFVKTNSTLQIPNSLGDKFSQWDSQNETLITHYEKNAKWDHARCFSFWENHVLLRLYLIDFKFHLKMSWIYLTNFF